MNSMDDSFSIDTERLTLRVPALADFDESAAMLNNPEVTRYLGARSFSREECWMRHLRSVGHWQLFGFGFWIVRARRSGQFVGVVGFGEFRREVEPSLEGSPEAGWVLTAPLTVMVTRRKPHLADINGSPRAWREENGLHDRGGNDASFALPQNAVTTNSRGRCTRTRL